MSGRFLTMKPTSASKLALALSLLLSVSLTGCTSGSEQLEGQSDLPTLPPVGESEAPNLNELFAQEQGPKDAPEALASTFPEYNWNQGRAIGSVEDFGLWITRQDESTCLIIAHGEGKGEGFSSGQRCKSEEDFESSGIQQTVTVDENSVSVWVISSSVEVESGWRLLNDFVAVPNGT